ncbi:MAG: hypothetical protein ACO1O4_01615 [Devosia sp.]
MEGVIESTCGHCSPRHQPSRRRTLVQLYAGVDWAKLVRKAGTPGIEDGDWSQGITAQTLLAFADTNSIRLGQVAAFYKIARRETKGCRLRWGIARAQSAGARSGRSHHTIIGVGGVSVYDRVFARLGERELIVSTQRRCMWGDCSDLILVIGPPVFVFRKRTTLRGLDPAPWNG